MEDDLMRIFIGDKVKSLIEILKLPEEQAIEAKMVSKSIEEAQSRVEGLNFDLRKHVLEYDDVMNKHREVIYKKRKEILEKSQKGELSSLILDIVKKSGHSEKDYEKRREEIGKDNIGQVEKVIPLRIIDMLWIGHLENMEYLRDSVRLRAYGNKDPLVEYKKESSKMFKKLLVGIDSAIVTTLLKAKITLGQPPESTHHEHNRAHESSKDKPGRNDPCPCGAKHPDGRPKKYKHCHGK
jgi:preprotein translocase subunit SecA